MKYMCPWKNKTKLRNYFNNFPEKGEGLLYVQTRDI